MTATARLFFVILSLLPVALQAQGVDPTDLLNPRNDSWPTYNGDYSGRRFSPLSQINTANVQAMSLAWVSRFSASNAPGGVVLKSTPLLVDGVLYFTAPNNVWAVNARTGREEWHYEHPPNSGSTIGNRGLAMYGTWLFFEAPDSHLVSLDSKTGKVRWQVQIADPKLDYTSTVPPVVIHDHVLVGIGGDHLDNPGFLQSRDPETGALQWKWFTTPRKGEPGIETWPGDYASAHGTGEPWMPGTYDPELNLYYVGIGNPNPVMAEKSRRGDNLYTCSIVALNPDTGKLVWYYQVSPHDVHDWDAVETPVLIDGIVAGKPRKLLAQASRNGYFFVLDRATGEHILTKPFIDTLNWATGLNAKGQPIANPAKYPAEDGVLVSPSAAGAVNWPAPSFSLKTGLFYVGSDHAYSLFYLTDTSKTPEGWAGIDSVVDGSGGSLLAIDYRSGEIVWRHDWLHGSGIVSLLSTASNLLFASNEKAFIVFNAATGKVLWHSYLAANPTAGPISYMLDGQQYVVIAAGDSLYSFSLNSKGSDN
jgi:alcohol dehydrogenase (cytochrome c)